MKYHYYILAIDATSLRFSSIIAVHHFLGFSYLMRTTPLRSTVGGPKTSP